MSSYMMETDKKYLLQSFIFPIILATFMLISHVLTQFGGYNLHFLAIIPRKLPGLIGILGVAFIHGSWEHLFSNIAPFILLSAGVLYYYREFAAKAYLGMYFLTNIWVWVAARDSYHIGASGWVYALAFFLFVSGIIRKDRKALILSLLVSLFYGGLIWGLLPGLPGISWESHVFGALSGIVFAFAFKKKGKQAEPFRESPDYHQLESNPELWDYKQHDAPPEGFTYPE